MTNADLPAFPQPEQHDAGKFTGLSKREYIAAMALQGLLARADIRVEDAPHLARQTASELLRELG